MEQIQLQSGESFSFDIHSTNPFLVFPWLQKLAVENVGQEHLLDLSRGDPGYGFSPSERTRRLFSYLVFLDSILNTRRRKVRDYRPEQAEELLKEIEQLSKKHYRSIVSKTLLKNFEEYRSRFKTIAASQGLPSSDFDILQHTFGLSNVSGGNYHDPWGEPYTRAVLAHWHSEVIGEKISYQDLLPVSGASHAIGALYEAFGEEGIGYLKKGDKAVMFSPSYFPYLNLHRSRGIENVMVRVDPFVGEINSDDLKKASVQSIKMIVLIDPNNPTGFVMNQQQLNQIADLAEKTNALVITDEVYHSFVPGKPSLIKHPTARKRTIRIDSLSKIERSTGIRFGDMLVTEEANQYISEVILKAYLREGDTLRQLLYRAKSPGGGQIGPFHHTTVIPGPSQFLGICHILLGKEEREWFKETLKGSTKVFYEALGVPYQGNIYYGLIDFQKISGAKKSLGSPEQCFIDLAQLGVVLLPADLFFLAEDRENVSRDYTARVSLANVSTERCRRAAEIIRRYVRG